MQRISISILLAKKIRLNPAITGQASLECAAPFEFIPLDMFKNAERTSMGKAISEEVSRTGSADAKRADHILGIQGQLWGENLSSRDLGVHGFSSNHRLGRTSLGSSPDWSTITDPTARKLELQRDWNQFANRLGHVNYRDSTIFPAAYVSIASSRGGRARRTVSANVAFPGLAIRYTNDGTEPDLAASLFQEPIPLSQY